MYFENYRRCSSCEYCKEITENKNGKFEVVALECMNSGCVAVVEDIFGCDFYKKHIFGNKMVKIDNVNHPAHYANSCSIECIDAMQATFGTKDLAKYCTINAYKYLWRYKGKNGVEDLKKAEWYLNKFDELVEEADNKPYSEQIPSRYINICITLRKWLKMANTALGGNTNEEQRI